MKPPAEQAEEPQMLRPIERFSLRRESNDITTSASFCRLWPKLTRHRKPKSDTSPKSSPAGISKEREGTETIPQDTSRASDESRAHYKRVTVLATMRQQANRQPVAKEESQKQAPEPDHNNGEKTTTQQPDQQESQPKEPGPANTNEEKRWTRPKSQKPRDSISVSDISQVNSNTCRYFAMFSRNYRLYKLSRRWPKLRRKSSEEKLYRDVAQQGQAYFRVIHRTLDVSNAMRAALYDVATALKSGYPDIARQSELVHRVVSDTGEVLRELRVLRVGIFKLLQNPILPLKLLSRDETPTSEEEYMDVFSEWWGKFHTAMQPQSTHTDGEIFAGYHPEELQGLARVWREAGAEFESYALKLNAQREDMEDLLNNLKL
ncbi:hypothetical protein ONZ45_g9683 [Pleurotus djamor]|nr:hypothetical protein ONZ45_g9683 [Pleurotus djamor]